MFGAFKLPDVVSDTAHSIRTNSIVAIKSATSSVIFYWNKFDREDLLRVVNDFGVFVNEKRLRTRKYLKPDCRQHLYDEVFVKFIESCRKSKKVKIVLNLPNSFHSEIQWRSSKDFQIEGLLPMLIWNLTQVTISEDNFTKVQDEKIQAWNTRLDEKELIRKIGRPSEWDIFQADDKGIRGEETENFGEDSEVETLIENIPLFSQSNESLRELCGTTRTNMAESKFTSGAGDGKSLDNTEHEHSRELGTISGVKRKHDVLHSIRKLLRHGITKNEKRAKNTHLVQLAENDQVQRYSKQVKDRPTQLNDENSDSLLESDKEQTKYDSKRNKETEGLTIQIPSNVEKIVLIKDGRKITVEL